MAINLGTAWVDIVPSTRNLSPQLNRQIVQPVSAAGDQAGSGFGSRFASGVSRFVGGVADTLSRTLTAASIAAGGLAATTLFKGWDRLTTIQDATASLTVTLGDASQAAALLDSVLDVVRGTPFNLDQFASAAQRLSGMGVEAQKIPGYLEAIGNAAALQGKEADQFVDRLVRVFGQIQAQGRVTGEDLLQISETGVNALAILANHFGITTDEMRKMVSDGAVPANEALDVLADGILNGSDGVAGATVALGGNMEALRQTLSGVAGGVESAMARVGAAFLEPFTPALTAGLNGLIDFFDDITPKVQSFAQDIANSDGFQSFLAWVTDLPSKLPAAIDLLTELDGILGPLLGALGGFALKGLSGLPIIGSLIPGIGPVVGAIAGLIAQSPELRESLGGLLDSLGRLGEQLIIAFTPVVELVVPALEKILGFGIEGLTSAVDYVTGIVQAFNESGIGGVWDKLSEDWTNAVPFVEGSLNSVWTAVQGWVSDRVQEAPGLFGQIGDALTSGFDTALNGEEGDGKSVLESLNQTWGLVEGSVNDEKENLKTNVSTTWPEAFTSWIDGVINGDANGPGIVDRMQGITDAIDEWVDSGGIGDLLAAGGRLFGALAEGWFTALVPGAIRMAQGLLLSFIKAIAAIGYQFVQIGVSIANSIIKGIQDLLYNRLPGAIADAIRGAASRVPGGLLGPLGGALSGKIPGFASGGPVSAGELIMVGEQGPELFVPGLSGQILPNRIFADFSAPTAQAPSSPYGSPVNPTFNLYGDDKRRQARDVVWELRTLGMESLS